MKRQLLLGWKKNEHVEQWDAYLRHPQEGLPFRHSVRMKVWVPHVEGRFCWVVDLLRPKDGEGFGVLTDEVPLTGGVTRTKGEAMLQAEEYAFSQARRWRDGEPLPEPDEEDLAGGAPVTGLRPYNPLRDDF
jgi:hypothetical protein